MKITRIETIPVRVPIKPELAIRSGRGGSHLVSPFLLVKIHTDEGVIGLGEASCTPRWSGEDQTTAAHFIDTYFEPLLTGAIVDDVSVLYAKFASVVAGNFFTKAAVEMALWDLVGKSKGQPVWQLLGQSSRHAGYPLGGAATQISASTQSLQATIIPTKWSVSGVEPKKAAEIARWAIAQGFSRMKVKVGIDPTGDVARVRAVRDAVGDEVKLGVDANGGWPTPNVAIDTIQRLCDECAIYFAEQPLPPGDHDAMAEVRRGVRVPIVADESIYSLTDAKMLIRAQAADVFSIYVGKAGGLGTALEIAEYARSHGIQCTIGSNLELGVGSAAMIHLAVAAGITDGQYPCDIIGPLFYEDDVLVQPLELSGGPAKVPVGPGLGAVLDDQKVEKYRAP